MMLAMQVLKCQRDSKSSVIFWRHWWSLRSTWRSAAPASGAAVPMRRVAKLHLAQPLAGRKVQPAFRVPARGLVSFIHEAGVLDGEVVIPRVDAFEFELTGGVRSSGECFLRTLGSGHGTHRIGVQA